MNELGAFRMTPEPEIVAGRPVVITLTWEVGTAGLVPGDVVEFVFPPLWSWQKGQTDDDRLEDYVAVTSSRQDVSFRSRIFNWRMNHRPAVEAELLGESPLREGDVVTCQYGKETPAQTGIRADRWASITPFANIFARFRCVIHPRGNDRERRVPPGEILLDIVPDAPAKLIARAPSIAKTGEALALKAALVDRHHNGIRHRQSHFAASDPSGIVAPASVMPTAGGKLSSGRAATTVGRAGVARIEIIEDQTGLAARANATVVKDDPDLFLYWGDIHGHSNESDGVVSAEDYFTYARNVAMLDFTSLSDHDTVLAANPESWQRIMDLTETFNDPGAFAALLGFEWTSQTHGHRNVYYRGSDGPAFSWMDEATDSPHKLWTALEGHDSIVVPHHPSGLWFTNPIKGLAVNDWSRAHEKECLVEIFSNWGNSERLGDPDNFTVLASGGHFVQDALEMGRTLGLIASSDSHNGHPGLTGLYDQAAYDPGLDMERVKYTTKDPRHNRTSPDKMRGCLVAVYAKELSRDAVFDALAARRCYATTGIRPIVEFTVNDAPMGSLIEPAPRRRIQANVISNQPIASLELSRNGSIIHRIEGDGEEASLDLTDDDDVPSGTFYYLRVIEQTGDKAWTSPVWTE